jgi:eukaryotic-like serine/threonine-protein kinase
VKTPRTLGRYEVVDLISQGGMGALYRARDPRIGRYVAIKLLRPGYDTEELRDRFSQEARAAGILSHPNIVTIYDVGEHDGLPFIAMEYVRGETFADLVCLRPPLSLLRKLQLTEEVCAGLAHAHEAGIVHRDIKPANLIVGPEGTVKILDFGIAKLSATGNTVPGSILGTLNYMSPEQVKGVAVDARADIFSVGAVLYELLSHQQAFPGQLPDDVLPRILSGVPTPLTEYCPDIDQRLVRLVDQALEKDPDQRFQSIAAVQKALSSIRLNPDGGIVTPPPAAPGRKTPSPVIIDPVRQRAQQIEQHLADAKQAFDAREYDAAIESCKQVLMLDASDERALSQIDRVHAAIEKHEEDLRIRAAFEEEQRRLEHERLERHRRISALLTEARTALQGQHLGEASERLDRVREIDAAVPELSDLTARLEAARAAVRLKEEQERAAREAAEARRRQGEQKLEEAAAHLENGDLTVAADMLKIAVDLAPQHQRIAELSAQLQEARERKAAAEAAERLRQEVEELIRSAAQRLQAGGDSAADLVAALNEVNRALALDPGNADAPGLKTAIEESIVARREAARARAAINNARRRFANGKHQAAIKLLEDYPPPPHHEIAETLSELRAALLEIEEQRRAERERVERQLRVAVLLAEARGALADQRFDQALDTLATIETIDAAVPDLPTLKDQVRREQAAARQRAELERTLADLDECMTRGDLPEASERLSLALALNATDARVLAARQRVEQAIAAREAAEARARELEEKQTTAGKLFEQGDLQGAMRLLTQAANLDAQNPRTALLTERVAEAITQQEAADAAERLRRTIEELVAEAEAQLQSPDRQRSDVTSATEKIARVLALDPEHPRALELKSAAEAAHAALRETAKVVAAVRNARNRFANGKHQSAIQLLESLDADAHPIVAETLKELRDALHEIEAEKKRLAEQAAQAQAAQDRKAPDDDATRVFIPPAAAASDEQSGPGVQPWRWGVIVAMGVFLLALIAALLIVLKVW